MTFKITFPRGGEGDGGGWSKLILTAKLSVVSD